MKNLIPSPMAAAKTIEAYLYNMYGIKLDDMAIFFIRGLIHERDMHKAEPVFEAMRKHYRNGCDHKFHDECLEMIVEEVYGLTNRQAVTQLSKKS